MEPCLPGTADQQPAAICHLHWEQDEPCLAGYQSELFSISLPVRHHSNPVRCPLEAEKLHVQHHRILSSRRPMRRQLGIVLLLNVSPAGRLRLPTQSMRPALSGGLHSAFSMGNGAYNGLLVSAQERLAHGFSVLTNYAGRDCLDNGEVWAVISGTASRILPTRRRIGETVATTGRASSTFLSQRRLPNIRRKRSSTL